MSEDEKAATPPSPMPRSVRIGSFLLSMLLTVLVVWLLGFVLGDIGAIDGPDFQAVVKEHVDPALRGEAEGLELRIDEIEAGVARKQELQGDLGRSMGNARETMQQMMALQRLALERQVPPTETERDALTTAQQRFLDAQDRFEAANAEIAKSNEEKFQLRQNLKAVNATIDAQEKPARDVFAQRRQVHEFKVASLKLAVIVPLFLLAAWAFARRRNSAYRPILFALLAATFWKLGRVMFDHFPREFFKYIAIVAVIAIVLAFLIWILNKTARPNRELLIARYREAYRGHLCPVCAYPIARGPLRFAFWTRKGPRLPAGAGSPADRDSANETPYACPSCGTTLFAACRKCDAPRHTLLPFCDQCGDELADGPLAPVR